MGIRSISNAAKDVIAWLLQDLVEPIFSAYRTFRAISRKLIPNRSMTIIALVSVVVTSVLVAPASPSGAVLVTVRPSHHASLNTQLKNTRLATPGVCPPSGTSTPAANSVAFAAESSAGVVQEVNQNTGAAIGSPISVGTSPSSLGYWKPATGKSGDPEVVVANKGSNSVSIIDAVSLAVVSTIALPAGASPSSVAVSPTNALALVVDSGLGDVSVIDLNHNADAADISLSTTNPLSTVAFASSGAYAYITDPLSHIIYVLSHSSNSAPFMTYVGSYAGTSGFNPSGIATDSSNTSSSTVVVGNVASGSYSLMQFAVTGGTTWTSIATAPLSVVPGPVALNNGSTEAYAALSGSDTVDAVVVGSSTATAISMPSSFTSAGAIALSGNGTNLLVADTGSSAVGGFTVPVGTLNTTSSLSASVTALATSPSSVQSWDAYVVVGGSSGSINVVNSVTNSLVMTIPDTRSPDGVAASPDGQYVYVAEQGSIGIIATKYIGTSTSPMVTSVSLPSSWGLSSSSLNGIAVSPNGDSVMVTDFANGAAYVLDTNPHDSAYLTFVSRLGLLGGTSSTTVSPQSAPAFSPDGAYAYVPISGTGGNGISVLQSTFSSSTGYTYDTANLSLTQSGVTLNAPFSITISPSDEYAYVVGPVGSGSTGDLFSFPVLTGASNGQLGNNTTFAPINIGQQVADLAYSPEDAAAFVTWLGTVDSFSLAPGTTSMNWPSPVSMASPNVGNVAVSPDGMVVAAVETNVCGGSNAVQFFNAATGATPSSYQTFSGIPNAVTFAPQASPLPVATSELADGATNPAEAAVSSGINDVVGGGAPSNAPGASSGVDTATGNYSLDLSSLSVGDLGINLDQSVSYDSGRSSVSSLIAKGWQNSYGVTATQVAPSSSPGACNVTVTFADGATTLFDSAPVAPPYTVCPTAGYEPSSTSQATLSVVPTCNGSDSCFVIAMPSLLNYQIDTATGQLLKITDSHGDTVSVSWGPAISACTGFSTSQICQVIGADGTRALTYSYPAPSVGTCPAAASSCVVVTDPLGKSVTYVDNSSEQLTSVVLSLGSTSATYSFTYNGSGLLASWCDPQNQAICTGGTGATSISWSGATVASVTGPTTATTVTPVIGSSYSPMTSFNFSGLDTGTGDGTVLVKNPDFTQSPTMSGASQTLDTYADFELVSSVQGYGALGTYGFSSLPASPISSESAIPLRDSLNLMPDEEMNPLAGQNVGLSGSTQYDGGVTLNSYDPQGNLISSTSAPTTAYPNGETSTTSNNAFNEAVTSTSPDGYATGQIAAYTTTNTYDSLGHLLTTTSPAVNAGGSQVETSNWYGTNGLICASRDAVETALYGVLTSCTPSGPHATEYSYDAAGELVSTTDPLGNTTQSAYNADGQLCATLTANGYATGARLTSCPSAATAYETVNLLPSIYNSFGESLASINTAGTSFAIRYSCFDANGDTVATVGPMGTFTSCASLSSATSIDTSFSMFDPEGNVVQQIAPLQAVGTQGPTTTEAYDANMSKVLELSPQGYNVWSANHSATLTSYEDESISNALGEIVASGPALDVSSSCANSTTGCNGATTNQYDAAGNTTGDIGPGLISSNTGTEPDGGTQGGLIHMTIGGTSTSVTDVNTYDANQQLTSSSSLTSGRAPTSTAYSPGGQSCWTAPTLVSSPSCSTPPTSVTSINYFNPDGKLIAQVGPGGHAMTCNPLAAFGTYTPSNINLSALCSFTMYYVYDEDQRLVKTIEPSSGASNTAYVAAGIATGYGYDANGNRTTISNPSGSTTTQTFDAADELVGQSYSDTSATTSFTFNADGTRATMVDSTGTTTYGYDYQGHLTSVTDGNGKTVTYGYNSSGQMTCLSYPNPSTGTWSNCSSGGASTNSPPTGDVTYNYDAFGKLSSIVEWNGDTFLYGYSCGGQIAWQDEMPTAAGVPSVTPCQSSGSTPAVPGAAAGVTDIVTQYGYFASSAGGQLSWTNTYRITTAGSAPLLAFGSSTSPLTYDANGNLTSEIPITSGTTLATDNYTYNANQELTLGPDATSTPTSYSYNASAAGSFKPGATYDSMALATQGQTAVNRVYEYAANGQACWEEANPFATTTQNCTAPTGTGGYRTYSYNASGARTGTVAHSFGTNTSLGWNQDTGSMTCYNANGATCTTPSSTNTSTYNYTYNADGLRMTSTAWLSSAVKTTDYTWYSKNSALLSNGTFNYLYGLNSNVPVAQIDTSTNVTGVLIADPSTNIRGVVEVSPASVHPNTLANYVDYSVLGKPISANGGTVITNGLLTKFGTDADSVTSFGFAGGYQDVTNLIYLVHRFYDQATGQFLSVDPYLTTTGQSYIYAMNNPVNNSDYLGKATEGYCGSANLQFQTLNFMGSICAVRTDNGNETGITVTAGMGLGSAFGKNIFKNVTSGFGEGLLRTVLGTNAGWSIEYQQSNADTLSELTKNFSYSSETAYILGVNGSITHFWGWGSGSVGGRAVTTKWIKGVEYGVGRSFPKFSTGAPYVATAGKSYTWLLLHNSLNSEINSALNVIDFFNPMSPDL